MPVVHESLDFATVVPRHGLPATDAPNPTEELHQCSASDDLPVPCYTDPAQILQ